MRTTIKDIAEMAGVAKSTVSRYLNGGNVSEDTAEKLKRIISECNYEPNTFAQSLKAKRTNLIGVIAPTLDSFMTSKLLMTMDEELKNHNITTMIMSTNQHAEREPESMLKFARQKVDAIVLITKDITKEHEEVIQSIHIPILVIGQETSLCKCIVYDDYNAGNTIGRYVASNGHREVVYLGVEEEDIAVGIIRKKGVLDGLAAAGVQGTPVYHTTFTFDDAMAKTEKILEECNPTAIICATDTIALGALKAIVESGRNFPSDISLTGFGGYNVSSAIPGGLTTIRFEVKETGKLAARSLLQMIEGEYVSQMQRTGFRLIEGNSVDKRI